MIHKLITVIKSYARNIKSARSTINPQANKQQTVQKPKIRFTEEQLSEMSNPNKRLKRPLSKILEDKINKQKGIKGQQENYEKVNYGKMMKKDNKAKFNTISIGDTIEKKDRSKPEEMNLDDLAKIRLGAQYLPLSYLKKVQKIFNKYDQKQLRQIADNFSKLMSLRYNEEKLDFETYSNLHFQKLQQKLPKDKQVEQIYLIGKQKIYEEKQYNSKRKIQEDPINPQISYSHNVIISYLLKRVPRTYASAARVMTEIKYKFPNFMPKSMIDFGSGLSSGSYAFIDTFQDTGSVYNIDPCAKMRKLSKYLTDDTKIQHFQTLGQLSRSVKYVDLVYMGYVLTELRPQMIEIYLQALHTKVKPGGLIVIIEYGSPFGSRLVHEVRKWAIKKQSKIVAPCPHQLKCPLSKGNQWCHFDQPTGMYSKSIFGRLPTDNAVQLQKFSYLVIKKSILDNSQQKLDLQQNATGNWDRIIFPNIKRGGHLIMNLCSVNGKYQKRIVSKSHGEEYKLAKKLTWGDLWRFGKRIPNRFRKQRKTGRRLW